MPKLLIVEDEKTLRRTMAQFFRSRGFRVAEAASLAEADAYLAQGSCQVALVDICLPDGNGLRLLARIGPERSIAMTATPDLVNGSRAQIPYFIEKPLDLERTAELVARVVAC